jgi:hypothetical protein
MEPDEEAMEYFAYEEYQEEEEEDEEEENWMRDMAQRMLDHWRDLCARPGTTSIVHQLPPTLPLVKWHIPSGGHGKKSVGVENWPLAEQAVNLFLDLDRSRGRGGAAPTAAPTSRQSQDHTATESELSLAAGSGDDEHDDDDNDYEGEVEQSRMQWMGELMVWVFAPRGTHACLSFLDDDHDDHADAAAAAAADDNRGRLEDDEDEDKLALFSWLGPSLSWWIHMNRFLRWWSYRHDTTTSRYMDEVCKYVAQRLPQAWRMLRACVATTTAATTSHHQSRLTRAQLEHVTKVLIVCLRCFDGAYAHPLRGTMCWLCATQCNLMVVVRWSRDINSILHAFR